jgi:hypothetical protein
VAVLGIGGLGHLGVQFSAKAGYRTVAIARGKDKEPLARKLGAHHYIDSQTQDPAAELTRLGGARVILATVTSGKAMTATIGGLAVGGKLVFSARRRTPWFCARPPAGGPFGLPSTGDRLGGHDGLRRPHRRALMNKLMCWRRRARPMIT